MNKLAASTALATLLLAGGVAAADDRAPEPTVVKTILPKLKPQAQAVALDSQGRIVALGGQNHSSVLDRPVKLARILPGGRRDLGFGTGGGTVKVGFGDEFEGETFIHDALAIDPEDRIYASVEPQLTTEHVGVVRFLPDGALDPSWGQDGVVWIDLGKETHLTAIALEPAGGLLVGLAVVREDTENYQEVARVARLDADGLRDEEFGEGGTVSLEKGDRVDDIVIDSAGRAVVSTWSPEVENPEPLYRLLPTGELDSEFGTDGAVSPIGDVGEHEIALDGQDRVVLSSSSAERGETGLSIARVDSAGALDEGFGDAGIASLPLGKLTRGDVPVDIDAEGRIVIGATMRTGGGRRGGSEVSLARLTPDGSPDASFGADGMLRVDYGGDKNRIAAIRVAPDGGIVTSGGTRRAERPGMRGIVATIAAPGDYDG